MLKFICECGWHGDESQVLTASNPFSDDPTETMLGCPGCREPNAMKLACDEPGCWRKVACGMNMGGKYRRICYDHTPH